MPASRPGRPPYCDDCWQPVIWALTAANGKWIALDPEPNPEGNQAVYADQARTLRTRQLGKNSEPLGYERRHMPHVATCPKRRQAPPVPSNVIPITRAVPRRR